jgi:uncharacterized protein (TIGR03086 family)
MTETADRYRKIADAFTQRIAAVPADGWDAPAPCEGWVARDIVQHVVDTSGFFLARVSKEVADVPAVADDPMGAWTGARDAILSALEDPEVASIESDTGGPMGKMTFEQTVGAFGVGDILVHTWDLSRAVGLDEHLDADEVHRLFDAMLPRDEMMRGSAFGPKVEVPDSADEQTKLIAFTGRQP